MEVGVCFRSNGHSQAPAWAMGDKMQQDLIQEINQILKEERKIKQEVRDRLLLACMVEIYNTIACLPAIQKRVEHLENRSFLLLAERHPKLAISLLVLLLVLSNLWMLGDVRRLILPLLGLPANLIP
ncbi:MAG: hypothetical protein ACPL3P_05855 [Anaerolineales bacterium]